MKRHRSYGNDDTSKLILTKGLMVLRSLLVFLFFFSGSLLLSQVKKDSVKTTQVISVKNGAAIYSLDDSFNSQIINSNIVAEGKTKVDQKGTDKQSVTIESTPKAVKNNSSSQGAVDRAKQQKEKESLKKVKKHLDTIDNTRKMKVFLTPVTTESHSIQTRIKEHVAIAYSNNDHKDLGLYASFFSTSTNHPFFEASKAEEFNNTSYGYLIAYFISVRPPPAV